MDGLIPKIATRPLIIGGAMVLGVLEFFALQRSRLARLSQPGT